MGCGHLEAAAADAGGGSKVAYSHDGKTLAIGGKKGVALMSTADESSYESFVFDGDKYHIWTLALSPDGKAVAVGGGIDKTAIVGGKVVPDEEYFLMLWRLETKIGDWKLSGKERIELKGLTGLPFSVRFSPDGKLLASADQNRKVRIWDVVAAKELTTLTAHTERVYDVAFSPDGKHLATVGGDSLKLWEVERILKPDKR